MSIPTSLGYVTESYQPPVSPSAVSTASRPPLIIHIQDAHTNYEAQKNIVSIMEQLVKERGLKLILVEGSDGDVSLAYLRSYGPPENRKLVAEKYLKAGIISAEEYLDIVSDYPLILWGVERRDLYDRNVEAFMAAETLQQVVRPVLASVRDAAQTLTPRLSDPLLVDLDQKAQAFDRQELSLAKYAEALESAAKRQNMTAAGYPNLERFLEVRRLEQSIDRAKVQADQQRLITQLKTSASETDLETLVAKIGALKAGTIKAEEFYATLQRLANASHVDLAAYPSLTAYTRYLQQSVEIKPTALSKELDTFSAMVRKRLATGGAKEQLSDLLDQLDLVDKLMDLRLSPEEYQRLKSLDLAKSIASWEQFLNAQLDRYGLPTRTFPDLGNMSEQLTTVKRFYEVAAERDQALVDNALAKLKETGEPIAVLITGGFHSPVITRMLKDQGVATVVLTPKVTHPTDEKLYRAVVKYKSGHGSFDEVMSIANSQ